MSKKSTSYAGTRHISLSDSIGYGIGNLGFGIVFQIIASYLVFYGTAIQNIPGSLIGLAVSIGVVWDGVTDPLMGYISDRTNSKAFGRRHLYLLIGCIGIAIFNYLLWVIDVNLSTSIKFLLIFADLIVIKSFLTIYATPYTALGAELSDDYNERTSIQGFKTVFFLAGIGFAMVVGPYFFFKNTPTYPMGQFNPEAYKNLGLAASLIMLICGLYCYFSTKNYIPILPKAYSDSSNGNWFKRLLADFKDALSNKDYRLIVFAYLFTNIASALVSTFGMHVFTYTFGMDTKKFAVVLGIQVAICIISQPLWVKISKKLDKQPSAILGLSLNIIGGMMFIALVLMRNYIGNNYIYMLPYAIITGFGTSPLLTLPLSMIADTIDIEELKTGKRTEGIYYGCQTLFYKLSQSVVIFMLGIVLDLIRFNPDLPVQPDGTALLLGLVVAVGSIIAFIITMYFYSRYTIDKNIIAEVQRKLQSQKNA